MQEQIILYFDGISNPVLDRLVEYITMLGEQYFFIIIITFIFWNISKREGFKLAAAYIFSATLNIVLKIAFRAPRPFETLTEISGKRIETATGYAFPSGHTQGAATFFLTLAQIVRKRWFSIAAIILILLVGASRMYLGVHWPVDIAGGLILGILMAYLVCNLIDRNFDNTSKLRKIFFRIEAAVILSAIALFLLDLFYLRGSLKIDDFFKIVGISAGVVYGFFFEEKYVDFSSTQAGWFKKIIRYVIGLALTIAILWGLDMILPEHHLLNLLRYFLIGLWVTYIWPSLGLKLRLFEKQSRV